MFIHKLFKSYWLNGNLRLIHILFLVCNLNINIKFAFFTILDLEFCQDNENLL